MEDEKLIREMLAKTLKQGLRAEVVGAFGSEAELLEQLPKIAGADIGLVDIRIGDHDCFDLVMRLKAKAPKVRLIWVTCVVEGVMMQRAWAMGLPGFIHKNDSVEELITAVQQVAAGKTYVSASVRARREALNGEPNLYSKILSGREQELLEIFGKGFSNEEAAAQVGLSMQTVKTHRRNIMARLGLHSEAELQAYAVKHGFVLPTAMGSGRPKRR